MYGAISDRVSRFMDWLLSKERNENLAAMLQAARAWMPSGEFYDYESEMATRMAYFDGSMQTDMRLEIQRRFPNTYAQVEREQVNLPLTKHEIGQKAKVFCGNGDLSLAADGERVEGPEQDKFQDVVQKARLWAVLKKQDAITQLCHRAMFKPWWDKDAGHVRADTWAPHLTYVVPDPERWWSVDSARAVLFAMPGFEGVHDIKYRYEVWGWRASDAANATGFDSVHFVTDGSRDLKINEGDVNPFADPITGEPILPFVWWQDDASTDVYRLGDDDLLTINRRVNGQLTDLFWSVHMQAFGVWVHSKADGGSDLGVRTMSPGMIVDLENTASLDSKTPTVPIPEVWGLLQKTVEANAVLRSLATTALNKEQAPESGYAIKLRERPLIEHRQNMIEIYRPYVIESVRRLLIVHNTYCQPNELVDLARFDINWTPGEMETPQNPLEVGQMYAAEIAADVSTAADWRAERYDEPMDRAQEAVEANAETNKASRPAESSWSPFGGGFQRAAPVAPADEPEEQDETDESEPEVV